MSPTWVSHSISWPQRELGSVCNRFQWCKPRWDLILHIYSLLYSFLQLWVSFGGEVCALCHVTTDGFLFSLYPFIFSFLSVWIYSSISTLIFCFFQPSAIYCLIYNLFLLETLMVVTAWWVTRCTMGLNSMTVADPLCFIFFSTIVLDSLRQTKTS